VSEEYEYDVFLSHNGADKDWVEELGAQIEAETIDGLPGSRKLRVFFDKWDIDVGDNLIVKINEGLKKSRLIACVLSPEFMRAPWPTFEWAHVATGDPINAQKRLIPLLRRDLCLEGKEQLDLCAPFKALKYIDFRKKEQFPKSYEQLVRRIRGQAPPRGGAKNPMVSVLVYSEIEDSSAADSVRELLLGNLLPVSFIPQQIYSAETEARDPAEVRTTVPHAAPFVLRDKRIFTFADLSDSKTSLRTVIAIDSIKQDSVRDWLLDDVRNKRLVDLLQRCLISHLAKLHIGQDKKKRFYFRPDKGKNRSVANPGDRSREVAAQKTNSTTGETFWVHHGARMRFRQLGGTFYLCVEPTYVFTTDGFTAIEGKAAGQLAIAWGGRQQNAAALRNLIFWAKAMAGSAATETDSGGEILLHTGAKAIKIQVLPSMTRLSNGIEFDTVKVQSLINQVDKDLDTAADDVVLEEDEELSDEEAE
jgi:hypothetical protein